MAVTYQSKYTCTTRKCHRHRIQDRIYFQNPVYKMDTLVVYMHRFTPGYIPVWWISKSQHVFSSLKKSSIFFFYNIANLTPIHCAVFNIHYCRTRSHYSNDASDITWHFPGVIRNQWKGKKLVLSWHWENNSATYCRVQINNEMHNEVVGTCMLKAGNLSRRQHDVLMFTPVMTS